jgi:flagellar basal-body rod protein FlgB
MGPTQGATTMIPRLTAALDFQAQALVLRSERQRLIAGNIANADTPGYKARDFDFAATLRAASAARDPAMASGSGRIGESIAAGVLAPTNAAGQVQPVLRYVQPNQANLDSNTVDMDRERANFMDNALKVDATLRFINGNVRTTLEAMRSHTQG